MAGLVLRRELRRRAAAFVGLALIVAIGGGVAIGALVAAHRTDRAYPDYVSDADVADLVINPSLSTRAVATAIRRFPGVRTVHSDALILATVSQTQPSTVGSYLHGDQSLQVRGSTDGRYEAVDRPVVTDGRFASGHQEVFVSDDYRPDLEAIVGHRLKVGDTIEMAFWWAAAEDAGLPLDTKIDPIGVERLRIAGFGRLPDEMLPDELYPRQRLIVSADVARRYTCSSDLRADMSFEEALAAEFPSDCARQYDYYALQFNKDDRRSKAAVRREFTKVTRRLAKDVSPSVREMGVSYYYISQDRADVDQAVRQVTQPTVAALAVFGVVAALATLTVVALGISRILRRNDAQQRTLHALGAIRGQRAVIGAGPPLVAGLAGVIGAVPVALTTSLVGPTGSVRAVTPSAGFMLPGHVVVPALVFIGVALVVITGALAWSAAKRASVTVERPVRRSWLTRVLAQSGRPAATEGVRAAIANRRADGGAAVLAGCVVALAAVVSAVVFATNLNALVQEPVRYGWPWDTAVITGGGYGDTDPAQSQRAWTATPR